MKRETKLTPAEILTLLELAEASERNRLNNAAPIYNDYLNMPNDYSSSMYPGYKQSLDDLGAYYEPDSDDGEWMNTFVEPSVKYYPDLYENKNSE